MSHKVYSKFGDYIFMDFVAKGGMACIWKGVHKDRKAGPMVGVKIIEESLAQNEAFKSMFMNEIAVSSLLTHQNITSLYEYGEILGQLFISMEFINGKNLKQLIDRTLEHNVAFPIEMALFVIGEICQGLHYAHSIKNPLNKGGLEIIHRDMSPHNIMVGYNGEVKIIDFGIAKSHIDYHKTQTGSIKGKLPYMAPEYLEGQKISHHFDQFSVGVILWELLSNKRLFAGDTEVSILKAIQKCKVEPPSHFNPHVTKEMDHLVLTALSRNPSSRFMDMAEMKREIDKVLHKMCPDFSLNHMKFYMETCFINEIVLEKERTQAFFRELKQESEDLPPPLIMNFDHSASDTSDFTTTVVEELPTTTIHQRNITNFKSLIHSKKQAVEVINGSGHVADNFFITETRPFSLKERISPSLLVIFLAFSLWGGIYVGEKYFSIDLFLAQGLEEFTEDLPVKQTLVYQKSRINNKSNLEHADLILKKKTKTSRSVEKNNM